MKNKKVIAITGGAGMIGSRLVSKLVELDYDVYVIDNLWRGKLDYIKSISKFNLDSRFFNIDLSNSKNHTRTLEIFKHCSVVVHLADIVAGIGYVFSNQYEIFKINNDINTNTFKACHDANIEKIIYAGTACSFPKDAQMSINSILKEDMLFPAEPESAYGWSKLIGSLELTYLKKKTGIDITTVVLHNVYGPNCDIDPKRSQVIPSLIRKVLELDNNHSLSVWGSGMQGRAFIHVDDVVTGLISVIERNNLPDLIQLGPDYCTSIKELALLLVNDIIKKNIKIEYDLTKPEGDIGRCADYTLAKNTLNWSPKVKLRDGLLETTKWIKKELDKIK